MTEEEVFADILDRTNAGVSVPERFTPWTAPRLLPYLLAVREKWGRAFDDNGAASAQIAAIAMVATLRPSTTPLVASSARNAAASSARPRVVSKPAQTSARSSTGSSTSSTSAATSASASAARPSGVWSKPPAVRGREIEKALGGNLPDNFPVIDKFNVKSGMATSIKSLDLHAKAYQDARVVTSKVKGYIDKVAGFNGKEWARVNIERGQVKGRVLELAIPSEGTAAQKAALEKLVTYGHKAGVAVKIKIFP